MLPLDFSMQETSRGASLKWTALRGPAPSLVSQRIFVCDVEKVFPFVVESVSIRRVVREDGTKTIPKRNHNFVVDSPILSVI